MRLPSDYLFKEEVHRGKRSLIWKVQHANKPLIAKGLIEDHPSLKTIANIHNQYQIQKSLDHPGIIKALALVGSDDDPIIITEDANRIALTEWLAEPLDIPLFLNLAIQLTEIVGYCHGQRVVHKDINPNNILIRPGSRKICLIDFGLAAKLPRDHHSLPRPSHIEGTIEYIAPEQTGRINRPIDQRTDCYALGATFFQMLTGKLPFTSKDPLELIHAHLAKQAPRVIDILRDIPKPIDELVAKLLEKDPDKRYQSCEGLLEDLKNIQSLLGKKDLANFKIARSDQSDFFQIKEKLYGRETQLDVIDKAFERACADTFEAILIQGGMGSGKTALIKEVQRSIVLRDGYVIAVDFRNTNADVPFAALSAALGTLCAYLAGQSKNVFDEIRLRILTNIGTSGGVLNELVPNLKLIIGEQPLLSLPGAVERQNYLIMGLCRLLQSLSSTTHPLLIVFENIEAADESSLKVIRSLLAETAFQHVLLICTLQDGVKYSDNVANVISEIGSDNIVLNNLTQGNIQSLIGDTFGRRTAQQDCKQLSEVIYRKTQGSPALVVALLKSLYADDLIRLEKISPTEKVWKFDYGKIESLDVSDNAVALINNKFSSLDTDLQHFLWIAACFPDNYYLQTVSDIANELSIARGSADNTAGFQFALLNKAAIEEGFVVGLEQEKDNSRFRFVHDSVKNSIYQLIDANQREAIHHCIAKLVLSSTDASTLKLQPFDFTYHLEKSGDQAEKLFTGNERCDIYLHAAIRSREASSFDKALIYAKKSVDFLSEEDESQHSAQFLEVMLEYYQALYLNLRFVIADNVYATLQPLCTNKADKVRLYTIRADQLSVQNRYPELVDIGLELLSLHGVTLPQDEEKLKQENDTMAAMLYELDFDEVRQIPKTDDPALANFLQVSAQVSIALYTLMKPEVAKWIAAKRVCLTLEKGLSEYGSVGYIGYAIYNFLPRFDYGKGYEFGKFAVELAESYPNGFYNGRANVLFSTLINHWKNSLFECFEGMRKGIIQCCDVGDVTYAPTGLIYLLNGQVIQGIYLPQIIKEISSFEHFINTTSSQANWTNFTLYKNGALQLQGLTKSETDLSTEIFTEEDYKNRKHLSKNIESVYASIKIRNGYLTGHYREVLAYLDKVYLTEKVLFGSIVVQECYFYMALAIYACADSDEIIGAEKKKAFLDKAHKYLKIWADNCPSNFFHRYLLLQAEKNRLRGNIKRTVRYYQHAMASAKECKFHNIEALIHLNYGQFWWEMGDLDVAKFHIGRARHLYKQWGAQLLVESLDRRFPTLLLESDEDRQRTHQTASYQESTLDLASIIKASQAISSEIDLTHLIRKMVMICMESAGVERACLFLNHNDELFLEAESNAEGHFRSLMQSLPLESCNNVPASIVQYVFLSEKNLSIENVSFDTQFTADPYFIQSSPQSLLCMPLVNQSKCVGVLYLESTLSESRFPESRERVLNTFLTQSAIAIVNAKLYKDLHALTDNLERKVEERTRELNAAKQLAERATQSKSEFLATMSHEIRTPMNGVLGMTQLLQNTSLTSDQQEILRTIQSSGESLLVIINDILDFSKIEAGKMELELITFSLTECIHDIVDMMAPAAQAKGLELIIDYQHDLPHLWIGDKIRLRQIITNFINNAIKFTHKGSVTLKVFKREDCLQFDITDTGQGIPADHLDKLFKAFSQVDASTTRNVGGTGLGLVIAQRLAQAMQGKVGVESEEGKGSRFWFTAKLPQAPSDTDTQLLLNGVDGFVVIDPHAAAGEVLAKLLHPYNRPVLTYTDINAVNDDTTNSIIFFPYPYPLELHSILENLQQSNHIVMVSTFPAYGTAIRLKQQLDVDVITKPVTPFGLSQFLQQLEERSRSSRPKKHTVEVDFDAFNNVRILLAEDNPVNQKVAQGILKKIGYSSHVAANGFEVVDAYKKEHWDLILMDCQMPEMDGFAATEAIRELEKEGGFHIPIIALTANAMQGDEQKCIRAGMDDYLAKPIQKEQLSRVIAYHLSLNGQNADQA